MDVITNVEPTMDKAHDRTLTIARMTSAGRSNANKNAMFV